MSGHSGQLTQLQVAGLGVGAGFAIGVLFGYFSNITNNVTTKSTTSDESDLSEPNFRLSKRPMRLSRRRSVHLEALETNTEELVKALKLECEALKKDLVVAKTQGDYDQDLSYGDVERIRAEFDNLDEKDSGHITIESVPKLCAKLGMILSDEDTEILAKSFKKKILFYDFLFWWTDQTQHSERKFNLKTAGLNNFEPSRLSLSRCGEKNTPSYRLFFQYEQKNGKLKQISPWHDIPLYERQGICNFICEIPKWTRAKYEIAVEEKFNPIKQDTRNGELRFYKHGDMMFNYGALPQTWENPQHTPHDTNAPGDNDPIDVIEIGSRQLKTGSVTPVKPLGVLALIDDGETDWKVIAIAIDDPMSSKLTDIHDVDKQLPGCLDAVRLYLRTYKVCVGKPENKFALGGRAMPANYTLNIINECHDQWRTLAESGKTEANYNESHNK